MNGSTNQKAEESITRLMGKVDAARDWLATRLALRTPPPGSRSSWPVLPGAYRIGDPTGSVAVCTLTSNEMVEPLANVPGAAIAGRVYSANLGLAKMISNVTANPAIRFLLVCGRESSYFQAGQALAALFSNGIDDRGYIIGASGHMPELSHAERADVERFCQQIELVSCRGELSKAKLAEMIQELHKRNPGPFQIQTAKRTSIPCRENGNGFKPLCLGAHRESLAYDPKGYFIISLDLEQEDILVRHYLPDNTPGHEIHGRNGEAILLALVREGLITQLSHAGYLGAELAKAETAQRLHLHYEQDRPLRLNADSASR